LNLRVMNLRPQKLSLSRKENSTSKATPTINGQPADPL